MFADGASRFTLFPGSEVVSNQAPMFDGTLETPNRVVVVTTTERKAILESHVATPRTRIRIWTNHPTEPDDVVIGLD